MRSLSKQLRDTYMCFYSWMNCVTACRRWRPRWLPWRQWIYRFSGQRLQQRRYVIVSSVDCICVTCLFHIGPTLQQSSFWTNDNNSNNNNNNNNNTKDDVYGAVIMAQPLREFTRLIWWMQNSTRSPIGLNQSSAYRQLYIVSTCSIAIYYYSAQSWYSFYRPTEGRRLSWPGWLVTYRDGLPVRKQSPIQAV